LDRDFPHDHEIERESMPKSHATAPTAPTAPASRPAEPVDDPVAVNVSVLCGECSSPPEVRVLESGTRLATFALRCRAGDGRATSVPVTVWDPPAWLETVDAGERLVVVGRLRRRFFQRPGGVGSRVDVEADTVGRARDRRRLDAARTRAGRALDALG
jgi:single-stranded DNA-binding protein